MTELRTAHTADLGAAEKAAIRSLMDAAFDGVLGRHLRQRARRGARADP